MVDFMKKTELMKEFQELDVYKRQVPALAVLTFMISVYMAATAF